VSTGCWYGESLSSWLYHDHLQLSDLQELRLRGEGGQHSYESLSNQSWAVTSIAGSLLLSATLPSICNKLHYTAKKRFIVTFDTLLKIAAR
jgi:hypothetical protein